MRVEQAVGRDEWLECAAMVRVREDESLNPGKGFRWREFTQLWIVERLQVQEFLQTRCWQLWKYILAEIQILESFEHGERVLFNLPDNIPLQIQRLQHLQAVERVTAQLRNLIVRQHQIVEFCEILKRSSIQRPDFIAGQVKNAQSTAVLQVRYAMQFV